MSGPERGERLMLTELRRCRVVDEAGHTIGQIADLVVDDEDESPRVVAVAVRGKTTARPDPVVGCLRLDDERVLVRSDAGETAVEGLRLTHDLLDAQVIDIAGHRLARVGRSSSLPATARYAPSRSMSGSLPSPGGWGFGASRATCRTT